MTMQQMYYIILYHLGHKYTFYGSSFNKQNLVAAANFFLICILKKIQL